MAFRTLSSKKFGPNKLVIQLVQQAHLGDYPQQDMIQVAYLMRAGRVFEPTAVELFRPHEIDTAMDAFDARKVSDQPQTLSQWARPLQEIFSSPDLPQDEIGTAQAAIARLSHTDQQAVYRMLKSFTEKSKALNDMVNEQRKTIALLTERLTVKVLN